MAPVLGAERGSSAASAAVSEAVVGADSRPHVGLNALLLSQPGSYRAAGISGYSAGLLAHLPEAAPRYRFSAWLPARHPEFAGIEQHLPSWRTDKVVARIAWEQLALPFAARRARLDLLHGLAFSLPVLAPCPMVVTIMDMSFAIFPQFHPRSRRLYLSLATRLAARSATAVIALSENTKRDACRILGIPAQKVHVVPCGVSERFRPLSGAERAAFRERHGLGPYIYYQGTLEPRKNLVRLIQAFARLRRQGLTSHKLVIGGAPGWGFEEVYTEVEWQGLEDSVLFLGFVPDDEAPYWYAAADVSVYPSLYEGFGLPLLEAMACGTPVVAADNSSLPEVVGDAGLLFPAEDVEALAESLGSLLEDEGRRVALAEAGLQRSRSYSWWKVAELTAAVYSQCLG